MKEYEIVAKFCNACAGSSRPHTFFGWQLPQWEKADRTEPHLLRIQRNLIR